MNTEERNIEIAKYYPLVRYVIRTRFPHVVNKSNSPSAYKYRRGMDFEDLFQEGVIALIHAYEKFDPDRGVKFHTVAYKFILNAVARYVGVNATVIRVPTSSYQVSKHGSEFSKARLRAALDYRLFTDLPSSLLLDGGEPINSTHPGDRSECQDPARQAMAVDFHAHCLAKLKAALPPRDYGLLLSRMNGLTFLELANLLGRSANFVRMKFESLAYTCHHILFQEIEDEK